MTAKQFYDNAMSNGVYYQCSCVGIGSRAWDRLMKGAVRANARKVEAIIKCHEPEMAKELEMCYNTKPYYNPYNHFRTKTHIIYIHSSIEYFFKIDKP